MRVDESRDHSPSAKIDDARLWPPQALDLLGASDRLDPLTLESHSFSGRPPWIRCQDSRADEDEIRLPPQPSPRLTPGMPRPRACRLWLETSDSPLTPKARICRRKGHAEGHVRGGFVATIC